MKESTPAIAALLLACGFAALATNARIKQKEKAEQAAVVEVPVFALNGVFQCEYYKAEVMHIENVANYSVTESQSGWNWMLELHDDTAIFFTQGKDKICYVRHVEKNEGE